MEIPHYFSQGDRVLLKQRRITKALPRGSGPYIFVRYKGEMCLTAEVRSAEGVHFDCSSSHLIPVLGPVLEADDDQEEWGTRAVRRRLERAV